MSAEDNLSSAQFPDDYPQNDQGPLKSKWIPNITNKRMLGWHIIGRHLLYERRSEPGAAIPVWAKNGGPERNGMTDEEYHDYLHKVGHFDKDSYHEHFTPKKRK